MNTSTDATSSVQGSTSTISPTTASSTQSPTSSTTSLPTSSPTSSTVTETSTEKLDNKLEIILPCTIVGGVMLIVLFVILFICYRKRSRQKSPPVLPSFPVPEIHDEPINPQPEEAVKPITRLIKHIPDKPILETKESVRSVTSSDGYFLPYPSPNIDIQDDPEYIDMTQSPSLPKPCGVVNKGYVNDPKNPQTNLYTIDETLYHYQNTTNSVPHMNSIETVNEYANIKSEATKRPISDIYENTDETLDNHQLLDYENALPKVSSNNVNTNENFTTTQNNSEKPLPSPINNRFKPSPKGSPYNSPKSSPRESPRAKFSPRESSLVKCSPRESPRAKSSPRESPRAKSSPRKSPRAKSSPHESPQSKSSPRESPRSKSSPRNNPEKYRGVKVM